MPPTTTAHPSNINQVVGTPGDSTGVTLVHAPLAALPVAFPMQQFNHVGGGWGFVGGGRSRSSVWTQKQSQVEFHR